MKRFIVVLIILGIFTIEFSKISVADEKDPVLVYIGMEKLALLWYEGLFGSGKFYQKELSAYIDDHIGDQIEIECNQMVRQPLEYGRVGYSFELSLKPWLQVRGIVSKSDLEKLIGEKKNKYWWQHSLLIGVKGRIRRYYIDTRDSGKQLVLFLDNMVPFVRSDNEQH